MVAPLRFFQLITEWYFLEGRGTGITFTISPIRKLRCIKEKVTILRGGKNGMRDVPDWARLVYIFI